MKQLKEGTEQSTGAVILSLQVKPMSVNDAWKGRRMKSPEYLAYQRLVYFSLPHAVMPAPPFRVAYEFGLSNPNADFDNPIKPLTDILQQKYGFNDRDIHEATVKKIRVKKGSEYFTVTIESI